MFGDDITIRTRRDYGIGREHGRPLLVEIRGLSGIIVIRPGPTDQPVGTTVEVRGRRKSFVVDEWSDPVNLVEMLSGYALACEFPIIATCRVPSLERTLAIEPKATARAHHLEGTEFHSKTTFDVDLATIDVRLRGEIRVCTLTDSLNCPSPVSGEAAIRVKRDKNQPKRVVVCSNGTETEIGWTHDSRQVCCDGILVAGQPGRQGELMRLGHHSCNYGFGTAAFIIDARGDLKPALTPARTPPRDSYSIDDATWTRLFRHAGRGYSRLLDQIVARCTESGQPERFWEVAVAYDIDCYYLHLSTVWQHLCFPFGSPDGAIKWHKAKDIRSLVLQFSADENERPILADPDGMSLRVPDTIDELETHSGSCAAMLEKLIVTMSSISFASLTELQLTLQEPSEDEVIWSHATRDRFESRWHLRCVGNLSQALCIDGRYGFANSTHAVIEFARKHNERPWSERSPFEQLVGYLEWCNFGGAVDSEVPPESRAWRQRKRLGLLFHAVDWDAVHPSLHPPYFRFRVGSGMEEMTTEHLARWAVM